MIVGISAVLALLPGEAHTRSPSQRFAAFVALAHQGIPLVTIQTSNHTQT